MKTTLLLPLIAGLVLACEGPSGGVTAADIGVPAAGTLGSPVPLLTADQQSRFMKGMRVFDSVFTPETGLGPLFNGAGCGSCHNFPVPGGSGMDIGLRATAYHNGSCDELHSVGGPVVQLHVTPALQAVLGISREPLPPGATDSAYRTTPSVWGSGLLDAVPDSEILARADPDDRDGDGVAGRPNWTETGEIGRFGRKAQVGTLWEFIIQAYVLEVGITNPALLAEEPAAGQPLPKDIELTSAPELPYLGLSYTDSYVRWLAPPTPAASEDLLQQGGAIFSRVGCAKCHVPALYTRTNPALGLSNQIAAAYTDLLLHDMGPDLADICMAQARPAEFRTEPLWGLRFRSQFMHDGRAHTIDAAIGLHGGEGRGARDRYIALPDPDRAVLLRFLGSL